MSRGPQCTHLRDTNTNHIDEYVQPKRVRQSTFLAQYRFKCEKLGVIAELVGWHGAPTEHNRYRCNQVTAACIMLRRVSSPVRWADLENEFFMHCSAMFEVFWCAMKGFFSRHAHPLNLRNNLLRELAPLYAECIHNSGAPLPCCIAFIDCTKINMCSLGGPNINQRCCYTGHKRMHCLNYQTIMTPDVLLFSLRVPQVGHRHDLKLFRTSGWPQQLRTQLEIDGVKCCLFGDSAYTLSSYMQISFSFLSATQEQRTFNKRMSRARVALECNYKDVKQIWPNNDYAHKLKVREAPVTLIYIS